VVLLLAGLMTFARGQLGATAAERGQALAACTAAGGPGAVCGLVTVPLDREDPAAGAISIEFALYRDTDSSRPSQGLVVALDGGLARRFPRPTALDRRCVSHRPGLGDSQVLEGRMHAAGAACYLV
jgi:hypothetical protein